MNGNLNNQNGAQALNSHDMNNPQNPFSLLQSIGTPGFTIPPQLMQSLTPQQLQLIQQKHQQMLLQRQTQQPQQQQQPQPQPRQIGKNNIRSTPDFASNMSMNSATPTGSPLTVDIATSNGPNNIETDFSRLPPQFKNLSPQMQQQLLYQLNQKKMSVQQQQYLQQQAQLRLQFQQQQQQAAAAAASFSSGKLVSGQNNLTNGNAPTKSGTQKGQKANTGKGAGGKGAGQKSANAKTANSKADLNKSNATKTAATPKTTAAAKKQTKKQTKAQTQKQAAKPVPVKEATVPVAEESSVELLKSSDVTPADLEAIRNRLPKLSPLPKYTIIEQEPELVKLDDPSKFWSKKLKTELNEESSSELLNYEQIVLRDREMLKQVQRERNGVSLSSKYGQSIKEYAGRYASDLRFYQDVKKTRLQAIENVKRKKSTKSIWGHGFQGYGNGVTDTETKVITGDRDFTRDKRTLYYDDISKLYEQAMNERQENLVPIRLDFEVEKDKFQLRDTFLINKNDDQTQIEEFVVEMLKDYKFKNYQDHVSVICNSIKEQISEYQENPFLKFNLFKRTGSGEFIGGDDLRIKIKIDIIIGDSELVDIIEWDISNPDNVPEEFAEEMCKELRLPGEFSTAISHQIREQVHMYHKALVLSGYQFDGNFIEDDEIRSKVLPLITLDNVLRNNSDIKNYTPNVFTISPVELDRLDKDKEKERDTRKRRRTGTNRINYNIKKNNGLNGFSELGNEDNLSLPVIDLLHGTLHQSSSSVNLVTPGLDSVTLNGKNGIINGAHGSNPITAAGIIMNSNVNGSGISSNGMVLDEEALTAYSLNQNYGVGGVNYFSTFASVPNIFDNLLNSSTETNNDDKDDENTPAINTTGTSSMADNNYDSGMSGNVGKSIISGLSVEDIEELRPELNEMPKTFRTLVPSNVLPGGYGLGPNVQSFVTKYETVVKKRPDPFCYIMHELNKPDEEAVAKTDGQASSGGVAMENGEVADPLATPSTTSASLKYFVKFKFKTETIKEKLQSCEQKMSERIKEELLSRATVDVLPEPTTTTTTTPPPSTVIPALATISESTTVASPSTADDNHTIAANNHITSDI